MEMVTLFCDASYCAQTGASGWGAWVKRGDWVSGHLFGDKFKIKMGSSSEAEIAAITNALIHCVTTARIKKSVLVMIQSDSLRALGVMATYLDHATIRNHAEAAEIRHQNGKLSEIEQTCVEKLRDLFNANDNRLLLRHVKGHKDGGGRQWVNRQCDSIAYNHMNRARKEFGSQLISKTSRKRARRLDNVEAAATEA